MGAYLSQPKTDKVSTDEVSQLIQVGSSSMQGWRNSQEDAHNSILNFDTNTSFFAVYDGHGGAEVATYSADKLPQFLKELEAYKSGDLERALREAFLGFDKTLLEPRVVETLKILAGEKNFADADSDVLEDDEDDEDLAELHEESVQPLNEVLEKYKGGPSMPMLKRVKESGGGSKPQSPYLRGRRAAAVIADAVNKAVMDPDAHPHGSSTSAAAAAAASSSNDAGPSSSSKPLLAASSSSSSISKMETDEPEEDSTVSSSSSSSASKNNNNSNNNNNVAAGATSAAVVTEAEAADGATTNGTVASAAAAPSSPAVKESEQNGSVTSSEVKVVKEAADVSTSSASAAKFADVVAAAADDGIVSGSNDAGGQKQHPNGNVDSSSASPAGKSPTAVAAKISSTSKETEKALRKSAADGVVGEDSTDDDADFDVDHCDGDELNPRHPLEYSSEEEEVEEEGTEDDDVDDDDEDEEEDDEEDEDEDAESALANEQFCANMIEEPGKDSGCTAVVALLQGRDLYVANAGDSRCVVCRNGKAIEMSLDHKPEDDEESARIIKAGGRVTLDGRVNGGLNLSRAIGDHAYKMNSELPAEEQMISALPDIKKLIITPEDEFMVLACDGIWNYMSSEEVVDFVRLRLKDESKKVSQICEELFDNCLAPDTMGDGTGCDNMTAVIVRFNSKILDLPARINPDETEDVLMAKRAVDADAADAGLQKSLKRSASPSTVHCAGGLGNQNSNEAENVNKTKRMKTDDEDTTTSTTTTNNNKSSTEQANNGNEVAASSSCSASAEAAVAEKKECDSASTAGVTNDEVSST